METNIRDYVKPERHVNIEHSIMQTQMQTLNTNIIYFHLNYIPGHSVFLHNILATSLEIQIKWNFRMWERTTWCVCVRACACLT